MTIKTVVIEGASEDIKVSRTDAGAVATVERFSRSAGKHDRVVAAFDRTEDRDARFAKALEVAKAVYGTDRRGRVNATNSMLHEVLGEIERVAGC